MSTCDTDRARFEQANAAVREMKDTLGYSEKEIAGRGTKLRISLFPDRKFRAAISTSTICRILNPANVLKWRVSRLMVDLMQELVKQLRDERGRRHIETMELSVNTFSLCLQQGVATSPELYDRCDAAVLKTLRGLVMDGKAKLELPPETPGMAAWLGGKNSGVIIILAANNDVAIHELEEASANLRAGQSQKDHTGKQNRKSKAHVKETKPAW